MRCEDATDRFFDLASDDLLSKDPQVLAHLAGCRECRETVARATRAWSLLGAAPEPVADSTTMRQRFDALLEHQLGQPCAWWHGWRPLAAAAALIVTLAAGVLIGRQFPAAGRQDASDVSAMRQEMGEMRELLTQALIRQDVASERIKGVSAAARIDDPRAELLTAVLDTLMRDSDVNVRLASLRALERFRERPAVRQGIVRALAREESPLVTMALIGFVVDAKMNWRSTRCVSSQAIRRATRPCARPPQRLPHNCFKEAYDQTYVRVCPRRRYRSSCGRAGRRPADGRTRRPFAARHAQHRPVGGCRQRRCRRHRCYRH